MSLKLYDRYANEHLLVEYDDLVKESKTIENITLAGGNATEGTYYGSVSYPVG